MYSPDSPLEQKRLPEQALLLAELWRKCGSTAASLIPLQGPVNLVDLGCGDGAATQELIYGIEGVASLDAVHLADHSDAAVTRAAGRTTANHPHLRVSAEGLDIEARSIDDVLRLSQSSIVSLLLVLQHLKDPDELLTHLAKLASGVLIVAVPDDSWVATENASAWSDVADATRRIPGVSRRDMGATMPARLVRCGWDVRATHAQEMTLDTHSVQTVMAWRHERVQQALEAGKMERAAADEIRSLFLRFEEGVAAGQIAGTWSERGFVCAPAAKAARHVVPTSIT